MHRTRCPIDPLRLSHAPRMVLPGEGETTAPRGRSMSRVLVIAACGLALTACSSGSDFFKIEPQTVTLQFESEPQGAEVKTSGGQTCRTPCALALPATELTATFALKGYKPLTIPVKVHQAEFPGDDPTPRFNPSPVYAELESAAPPPKKKPAPAPARKPAAPKPPAGASAAPTQRAPAQAPGAASPWPPAPAPAR